MRIHPGSVVAQRPHSAIIYDELVGMYSHFKICADSRLRFSQLKPMHGEFQL